MERSQFITEDTTTLSRKMWNITNSPWHVFAPGWDGATHNRQFEFNVAGYESIAHLSFPFGSVLRVATNADATGKPGSGDLRSYLLNSSSPGLSWLFQNPIPLEHFALVISLDIALEPEWHRVYPEELRSLPAWMNKVKADIKIVTSDDAIHSPTSITDLGESGFLMEFAMGAGVDTFISEITIPTMGYISPRVRIEKVLIGPADAGILESGPHFPTLEADPIVITQEDLSSNGDDYTAIFMDNEASDPARAISGISLLSETDPDKGACHYSPYVDTGLGYVAGASQTVLPGGTAILPIIHEYGFIKPSAGHVEGETYVIDSFYTIPEMIASMYSTGGVELGFRAYQVYHPLAGAIQ